MYWESPHLKRASDASVKQRGPIAKHWGDRSAQQSLRPGRFTAITAEFVKEGLAFCCAFGDLCKSSVLLCKGLLHLCQSFQFPFSRVHGLLHIVVRGFDLLKYSGLMDKHLSFQDYSSASRTTGTSIRFPARITVKTALSPGCFASRMVKRSSTDRIGDPSTATIRSAAERSI